jgi:hypothetical protein
VNNSREAKQFFVRPRCDHPQRFHPDPDVSFYRICA